MQKIKILIADDHEIVRFGIRSFLSTAEDIQIAGEASRGEECLKLFKKTKPDVCMLDITMPGMNGIDTARKLRELDGECRIIFLSMHLDRELLREALQCDVNAYLLKHTDKRELLQCIRTVMCGQRVYSKAVSDILIQAFSPEKFRFKKLDKKITKREQEVLSLIVQGQTSQDIAEALYISPRTVETHRSNLLQKLEIKNTAELVRFALEHQLG